MLERMTSRGMRLRNASGDEIVVAIGDQVRLANGCTGRCHCWTDLGVMVVIPDMEARRLYFEGLRVKAFNIGDGQIIEIIQKGISHEPAISEAG